MSCQLIVYGGGSNSIVGNDGDIDGGVGGGDCCSRKADPVLDSVSNSYSKLVAVPL